METGRFNSDVESSGVFTLASGSSSVDFGILGTASYVAHSSVYTIRSFSNSDEMLAFFNSLSNNDGTTAATLTLRDGPKP